MLTRNYLTLSWLALAGLASPAVSYAQKATVDSKVAQAMQSADSSQIKADITYLADDKLKGRLPGTEGFKIAADYVIEQMKKYGVQPAGENGSWTQQVRLRKAFIKNAQVSLTLKGNSSANEQLASGRDAVIYPDPVTPHESVSGDIVFAGFGITNPEQHYDDYSGIDVKGKMVMVFRGAPQSFPSSEVSHFMDMVTIQKTAAAHGAVGVILGTPDSLGRLANTSRGIYSVLDDKGSVVVSRSYYSNQIKALAVLSYSYTQRLLQASGKSSREILAALKSGHTQSADLRAELHATYESSYQDVDGFNIVGKIPGSDPKLKQEYVVHSAHLDHLGISVPVQGDSIYNGAHDNASGVASMLQIAHIYANLKVKPKRSILLVAVTGEELGDLGSGYFAAHPTVPVKNMVADVNTDMPTIIAPLLSVTALGAEHSSLAKVVDEAASYLDLSVEPDPEPKENRFVRSDQYSFVKQGIPALHIKYGSKTPDGKNNLNEKVAVWRAKYYHKPQDDINGIFDFRAGAKYAQLNFLIGYLVANDPQRPEWNKGDIFATKE
ncbi:M28 family peptidase [Mucilaginibacter robiniae]|uniref:M28 family peptidase n=1 Tax=Mucilaginibacter robiniae TaxID=2728022 RepID=A0A7L5E4Q9_9SPHI|nr:M28 family peptidase [Mucilaginibacter robiniae]QJD98031.1 M28 family peptidase [Mucilaginibacter robiniae]